MQGTFIVIESIMWINCKTTFEKNFGELSADIDKLRVDLKPLNAYLNFMFMLLSCYKSS